MIYYTYISRKQIGVIFSNWKKGNLNLDETIIKFLYNECAEVKGYNNNNNFEDVLERVKDTIQKIFAGDYKEAENEILSAYRVFNLNFK